MSKSTMEKLIIYGCGGHARSLADIALSNGVKELVFIDNNAKEGETLFGHPVVIGHDHNNGEPCLVAIGDNHIRASLFNELKELNKNLIPLIAQNAHIGVNTDIQTGVFIGGGAHIGPQTIIGENTIINTHCVIEHDCRIGKHAHISVNANIAGKCVIGDFVMVGTGATVIDNIQICDEVIIGAGAVVIDDITEPGIYVGVPARKR